MKFANVALDLVNDHGDSQIVVMLPKGKTFSIYIYTHTGEFIIKPVVIFGPNVQKFEFENVFPFGSMTPIWLSP